MKNAAHAQFLFLVGVVLSVGCGRANNAPATEQKASAPTVDAYEPLAINETTRFLENRVRQDPEDFVANNKLAAEYLQRLRETGDVTYLNLASSTANASLGTLPAEQNKGG